ncbi:Protein kinase-like domain [Trinorchestia longiramus]|nr:Protein kinase-like domain [Trinorchestia longiramus]
MEIPTTEVLQPQYLEGQFSDADEDSAESHRECRTLNGHFESLQLEGQKLWTSTDPPSCDAPDDSRDDPNSLLKFHFKQNSEGETDEDDDYDYDEDIGYFELGAQRQQVTGGKATSSGKGSNVFQPEQFSSRLCFDQYTRHQYTDALSGMEQSSRSVYRDKDDRKTVEKVLDKRTTMVIHKYINNGDISAVHGCISTGKEANVYFCPSERHGACALKIYKTSVMVFKDRDRYVTGDFKFRHGYAKHNSRKKIRVWAEKEYSNLHKLFSAGLPVPQPFHLRAHLLLMQFLGEDGDPAPLLKDVVMTAKKATELYLQLVLDMWTMHRVCKLVHADLSEFNLLVHNNKIYIIDVSQSVTPEHPHAFEFLRKDCHNVTEFFRKKGVATMKVKELFYFLVDPNITDANKEACFQKLIREAAERDPMAITNEEKVDAEVFKGAFIPQSFTQVVDFERDYYEMKMGQRHSDELDYQAIIGMAPDLSAAATVPRILLSDAKQAAASSEISLSTPALTSPSGTVVPSELSSRPSGTSSLNAACDNSVENFNGSSDASKSKFPALQKTSKGVHFACHSQEENACGITEEVWEQQATEEENISLKLQHPVRNKDETAEERRARKKEVKDGKAEKRKTKIPKHIKKRAQKK